MTAVPPEGSKQLAIGMHVVFTKGRNMGVPGRIAKRLGGAHGPIWLIQTEVPLANDRHVRQATASSDELEPDPRYASS